MDVKARSKPMRNILDRLLSFGEFEVILFGDHVILDEPIEYWPPCDILLAFFSRGFPLAKAIEYSKLRHPFCVNDLLMQYVLLDRRLVMLVLEANDVPTPRRLTLNRDGGPQVPAEVVELVSRDFNINLNNPKLFAPPTHKVTQNDDELRVGKSSITKPFLEKPVNAEDHNICIYYPQSMGGGVRRLFRKVGNKSSDFIPETAGIRDEPGTAYLYEEFLEAQNAEDVKVYTVGLHYAHAECRKAPVVDGIVRRNAEGKELRTVTEMTCEEQEIARRVCMAFGQTVCGFDIIRAKGKSFVVDVNGWSFVKGNSKYYDKCASILRDTFLWAAISKRQSWKYEPFPSATEGQWRLKTYICILRHGDRTPKQKLKVIVRHSEYLEMLPADYAGEEDVVIREKEMLERCLTISRKLLENSNDFKLKQLVEVLEKKIDVPGTKLQLRKINSPSPLLLIIVKWGGDFTHAGRHQSQDLGESIRKELLILNKSLLDDIQIFCSSERRVLATAEVFTKALLAEAEVPPNFIVVMKDALDDSYVSKEDVFQVKKRIGERLVQGPPFNPTDADDPVFLLDRLRNSMQTMQTIMLQNIEEKDSGRLKTRWCCSDSLSLFRERWERHFAEIIGNEQEHRTWFDTSRISDLYDSLKFDALHHRTFLEQIFMRPNEPPTGSALHQLYFATQKLFDFVAPLEYGLELGETIRIGRQISGLLLQRVVEDLKIALTLPFPNCRFYFTKESHMTALLNLLKNGGLPLSSIPRPVHELCANELDYLSHICFELFEKRKPVADSQFETRYSLRIGLSNGAHNARLLDLQLDNRHALGVTPKRWLTDYLEGHDAIATLHKVVGPDQEERRRGERKVSEPMRIDIGVMMQEE